MRARALALIAVTAAVIGISSAGASPPPMLYGASVSPASGVPGNSTVAFTLTLKNESTNTQKLGWANFWAPTGWTVSSVPTSPPGVVSTDGHTWYISKQTGSTAPDSSITDVVQFRAASGANALAPGASVSATVSAILPCATGPATWQTKAMTPGDADADDVFQPASGDVNTTVAVGPAPLGSFTFAPIATQVKNVNFTATVTAYDTCGHTKTDYSGGATLTGNLTGLGNPYSLTWGTNTGVGTASLTPTASQFAAKLHVADGTVTADSNAFDVVDKLKNCDPSGPCNLTNGTTTVDSPTPPGGSTLSVGLLSGGLVGSFAGCTSGAPLNGGALVKIDPSGYTGAFTVTLTYDKSILHKGGVPDFIVCKSNDDGATWKRLRMCDDEHLAPPCILSRHKTHVGSLVETLLVTPTDPAYGTD